MKEQFLRSIRMIYPDGVTDKHHMRDIIKIYFMGYLDSLGESCLIALENEQLKRDYAIALSLVKPMTNLNWWPDSTWRWW